MTRHPRVSLTVSNPQNRFDRFALEYDEGEAPDAELEVYEDQSKSILATNDSPDVGFRWSVNPYRGCTHACSYCHCGDTPILMADATTRALRDVRVGDAILGTRKRGQYRYYERTLVLAHWRTVKRAFRVTLHDGTELVASADHRFLSERGWKHVTGAEHGPNRRPFLTTSNRLLGTGKFEPARAETAEYVRGYLAGMIRGDGCLKRYQRERYGRRTTSRDFRPALIDLSAIRRTREYLERLEVETRMFMFQRAHESYARIDAISARSRNAFERICSAIEWPVSPCDEWKRGFLAGVFDAEGSRSAHVMRISNTNEEILRASEDALRTFRFSVAREPPSEEHVATNLRVRGGLREHLRFAHLTGPAIRRKWNLEGIALKQPNAGLRVKSIEDLGFELLMFDITTGTGDFIANGVVSHNCYARPSHEYLSLGAGTDFSRKIVIKRRAPELLREAFDKSSWKGELVVFSGITDCYQPLENKLKITRGCLEVCAEYRNPVGVITKSPVIERDVDVLQELTRKASARVSVSVPFWDPTVAKALEPTVTTPERRMKIVETLAKAGIRVGVSVSPIVPGLNDEHLGDVLERARDAGATHAFYVLLRLPGAVKEIFEQAMQKHLPLRAEKVMRRLKEAHGGKVYDSTFGSRGRGNSTYTETIRLLFERTAIRCGLSSNELSSYEAASTFKRPPKNGQTSFDF